MVVAPEAIVEYFSGIVSSIDFRIVGANLVCSCLSSSYSIVAIFDTHQLYASVELISNLFVTSVAEFSYTSSLLSAYHFTGSVVIFIFLRPLVGYRFRSLHHVSAHVPSLRRYKRNSGGFVLFTSSFSPPPPLSIFVYFSSRA
jgi:hypothetical protein